MSRPTDTERGARMALSDAEYRIAQRDLFPQLCPLPVDVWEGIAAAARDQLEECQALTAAQRGAYAG